MSVHGTRDGWEERRSVVEPVKLQASDGAVTGDYLCESAAMDAGSEILTFHFDNSYSKLRDKAITFRLEIVTAVGTPRAQRSNTTMEAENASGTQLDSPQPPKRTATTIEELVARNRAGDSGVLGWADFPSCAVARLQYQGPIPTQAVSEHLVGRRLLYLRELVPLYLLK